MPFENRFLQVALSLISRMCSVVNSQNLKVSGTLEEIFLKRSYQGENGK